MIKYLMDLDFCLKLFFCRIYNYLENQDYKIKCRSSVEEVDKRIMIFNTYCSLNYCKSLALKYITEKELNIVNETLKIYDFIVIGNIQFHYLIKGIENYIKYRKIAYLSISQVRAYLISQKNDIYRNFNYFIIIDSNEAQKIYKELYTIKNDFSLIISLIIYIKNVNSFINKRPFLIKSHISIFWAYNNNEIINYINSQGNINCGHFFSNSTKEIIDKIKNIEIEHNIKIPKLEIEYNKKVDNNDGWELVDFVPKDLFKRTVIKKFGDFYSSEQMALNMHKLFKENKIESLFYEHYCKYFFPGNFPELLFNSLNVMIKHFCYAYTLHENSNSFYYLMNRELRQGNFTKIDKYLDLISLMNEALKINYMKTYKGIVFRATVLEIKFIKEKMIKGKSLTNLAFFSASKERKEALNFLTDPKRNVLFSIKTKTNNIDIDAEKISKFENEKEVLFLPFSKFLIEDVVPKMFLNKVVYEIKLEGLDNEHERGNIHNVIVPNELKSL